MPTTVRSLTLLAVLFGPAAMAREFLYVHNTNSGEISKISIPDHEVVGRIPIGLYMDYVTRSPDNRTLYVNRIDGDLPGARAKNVGESGELIAIDTSTDRIVWRMDLDGMPHHMCASADGKLLFVPYYDTWWLAVVDVERRTVIKKIWIGHGGHGTELSANGARLYVGTMMNDTLSIVDTHTLEVTDVFHFRDAVRPFAVTRDESRVYVQQSWLHGFVVLDPTSRELRTIHLPDLGREVPTPRAYPHNVNHGITLNPAETELWCNGSALDFVAVYTHPSLENIANIPVGTDPNALVFSNDGRFAYVSNRGSNDLSIIDTATYREIQRLKLGRLPQRMVVIDVPE